MPTQRFVLGGKYGEMSTLGNYLLPKLQLPQQGLPAVTAGEFVDEAGDPAGAEPDADAIDSDRDVLDQELDDPRLLGREELVPERIELKQRLPDLGLGDVRRLFASGAPRADDELRLPEDAAQLVDDRRLDSSAAGTRPIGHASGPRLMATWVRGTSLVYKKARASSTEVPSLIEMLEKSKSAMGGAGTAVFLTSDKKKKKKKKKNERNILI